MRDEAGASAVQAARGRWPDNVAAALVAFAGLCGVSFEGRGPDEHNSRHAQPGHFGRTRAHERSSETMPLAERTLGRTGLEVTALGYGAMEVRGSRIWGGR